MTLDSKTGRILQIYDKMHEGETVNRNDLSDEFNVDERTIRRYIATIKKYLEFKNDGRSVVNSNSNTYYKIENYRGDNFDKSVLLISKILLDSRAFNKSEKNFILNSLIEKVSEEKRKVINKFIRNENYNYVELEHGSDLIEKIWKLTEYINKQEKINIKYRRADNNIVDRQVSPLGIVFSEFYFYLLGNYSNSETTIVLRTDRILEIEGSKEKYKVNYSTRFQEGEFKKRVQFMYSGNTKRVKFLFEGGNIEAVKDRLPTARIRMQDENKYIIEAEVIGEGIIMWLLSQGSKVTVIEPKELVIRIKEEIRKMNDNY